MATPAACAKPMHHLAHTRRTAINPVELREFAAGDVVVDIDQEEIFEPAKPGALQAVALQQNCRVVRAMDATHGADGIDARQLPVLEWNAICR